jgi:hypothetical protein
MKIFEDKKSAKQWKKINGFYGLLHNFFGFSFLLSLYSQPDWLLTSMASVAFAYILLKSLTYAYFSIIKKFVPDNLREFLPFAADSAPFFVGLFSLLVFFSGIVYVFNLIFKFY